jgi:4-amino-4-deoxy-L-arabinose transferase-like glycosyltransferase
MFHPSGAADQSSRGSFGVPLGTRLLTPWTIAALTLVLLIGALLRLAMVANAPAFVLVLDSAEFYTAGYRLLESGEFAPPLKRAPLYPFFLAGMTAVAGPDLETIALVQHLIGLGTVLLAYFLGALAFGRITGLLTALGVAVNGSLLLMEHTINAEALFTPLLLATLLLLFLALRSGRVWPFLLAGAVLGVGALSRPVAQALIPLMAGAVLVAPGVATAEGGWLSGRWRPRLVAMALFLVGFLLAVGPWIVRNYAVHGIVGISGGSGHSLVARVRRHDTGFEFRSQSETARDEAEQIRARIYELAETYPGVLRLRTAVQQEFQWTEVQTDAALRAAAMHVIRQQSGYYLQSTAAMFFKILLGVERPMEEIWVRRGNRLYVADQAAVEALTSIYQDSRLNGVVALLFTLGTVRCLASRRAWLGLLPAIVLTQLLLYVALDGPLPRYRHPMQPLITMIACGGLTLALGWLGHHSAQALRDRLPRWPNPASVKGRCRS